MSERMDDDGFDAAMVTAAFGMAGGQGWRRVNMGEAAQVAGLDLGRARMRFPTRGMLLLRFGVLADRMALGIGADELDPRERLFDMLMRRFDMLQQHRDGVLALMSALPFDPGLSLLLYGSTLRSMNWLLAGAGVPAGGVAGAVRTHGLMAVWLSALRVWQRDDSAELSATMAAVDKALTRAVEAERWLPGRRAPAKEAAEVFEEPSPDVALDAVSDAASDGAAIPGTPPAAPFAEPSA